MLLNAAMNFYFLVIDHEGTEDVDVPEASKLVRGADLDSARVEDA